MQGSAGAFPVTHHSYTSTEREVIQKEQKEGGGFIVKGGHYLILKSLHLENGLHQTVNMSKFYG